MITKSKHLQLARCYCTPVGVLLRDFRFGARSLSPPYAPEWELNTLNLCFDNALY